MLGPDKSIALRIQADVSWIALVQSMVEQAAGVFGLKRDKTLRLTMAAEELVAHLATTAPGVEVNLTLKPGGWCVLADFSFEADPSDLWAMNLAARDDIGADKSMEHLGLLLASRMVDGFSIRVESKVVHLVLRQDRHYPTVEAGPAIRHKAKGAVSILENPESALIKEACVEALGLYPPHLQHQAFFTPGKVVDMLAAGDLSMAVAVDATGALAGMVSWRATEQSVSFSGPYIFTEGGGTAEVLETHLLNSVARTSSLGLFTDLATADLITSSFEQLGSLDFVQPDGESAVLDIWYRHLREDEGTTVWAHPEFRGFLEQAYDQLVLMRTIHDADAKGETLPERSVFSARIRQELSEATLSPMVVGSDVAEVVAHHVTMLKQENLKNIFFHIDLAYGWQASMGNALLENGFKPKVVLPYAGKSDIVVFQHG